MKISCRNLWKVFGDDSAKVVDSPESLSKSEILEKTGQVVAVKDVSFDVREGETFVIMGLSGSGKSTLIRCLTRLIEPTSGHVEIDGVDVTSMNRADLRELRRHKVSMVFQYFGLFPHKNIMENITFGLEVQGVSKAQQLAKAEEVLALVGLEGWGYSYPRELSGGMQQRVGLARALAVDPEILLFDEPFSALDPLIRRDMQDELIELRKVVKKTMVFITHDFVEAIKLADTMAIMRDGEIVQTGRPEDIVLHPVDEYVRDFSSDVPSQKVLTVSSIIQSCENVLDDTETIGEVWERINSGESSVAFVSDAEGCFVGVVTVDVIQKNHSQSSLQISEFIDPNWPTFSPDAKLDELMPFAARKDVPFPVVGDGKRLLGFVDRASLMLALVDKEVKQ